MKTLKTLVLVVIALFTLSELAVAKGAGRKPDPRSMTPEEFALGFPNTIFPENRARYEGGCILLSKEGRIIDRDYLRRNFGRNEFPALEWLSAGRTFDVGFTKVTRPDLLPREFGEFIESFKKTQDGTSCQEVEFFWQASQGRILYERLFGNDKSLDERNAHRIVGKKVCGKYCLMQAKDLSEYSYIPYNLLCDSPAFLFFGILGVFSLGVFSFWLLKD